MLLPNEALASPVPFLRFPLFFKDGFISQPFSPTVLYFSSALSKPGLMQKNALLPARSPPSIYPLFSEHPAATLYNFTFRSAPTDNFRIFAPDK